MSIISSDISKAVEILTNEDVVAIPTETVYGLAGNIFSEKAIRRIFEVKGRPLFNPLIVHINAMEQVEELALEFPPKAKKLAEEFWPGSLTLVLKKKNSVPDLITAGKNTVGIRMPNHPVTKKLLQQLSFPLAAPSANPFNRISPTRAEHVNSYFSEKIDMVLDGGECKKGLESTIVGFDNDEPVLYRLGSISIEEIEAVVGKVSVNNKKEITPEAPGMLAKHYAPMTKTYLVDHVEEFIETHKSKRIGVLRFSDEIVSPHIEHLEVLSKSGDLEEAAARLYDTLHKLDGLGLDLIIAERFPNKGLGKSINDRLERAAN